MVSGASTLLWLLPADGVVLGDGEGKAAEEEVPFLACHVSVERSAVTLIFLPMKVRDFLSLAALRIFSLSLEFASFTIRWARWRKSRVPKSPRPTISCTCVLYFSEEREREREAETQAEGEAGSMHREPDVGFDPGSPGSRPGPKAGAKPLRHPGIPKIHF
ncbi:unnamed protein product [Nyctereutes procyonoides]|uniref:(raccoon dog) hypothetical protein n=1 Tax=Nyctereutes procyonoides TaxID=34880 RepID=A0A811YS82_NYCPR|nr:unnamed protein product [Nyctereutes procyonoides]